MGDGAARAMGRVAIEDFAQGANAVVSDGLSQRFEERKGRRWVLVDTEMGHDKRTKEPAPDRTLMVGAITFARPA